MSKNILIVDDSMSIRQMVNLTLTEAGFNIIEATNGQEGLDKLNDLDDCQLVISDINMPVMNGIEFIKNIREKSNHKYVPIIVLTTETEDGMQAEAKKAGTSAWLVKPFSPPKLIDIVQKITE